MFNFEIMPFKDGGGDIIIARSSSKLDEDKLGSIALRIHKATGRTVIASSLNKVVVINTDGKIVNDTKEV